MLAPDPAAGPVAASETFDVALARSAIEEAGFIPVLVQDAAGAIRHLSGGPKRYAALVSGERIGRVSGFTLCGVARDAGCRLPMLLLTRDACRGPRSARHDCRSACFGSLCRRTGSRRRCRRCSRRGRAGKPARSNFRLASSHSRRSHTGRRRELPGRLGAALRPMAPDAGRVVGREQGGGFACLRGGRFLYMVGHPRPFGGRPPLRSLPRW